MEGEARLCVAHRARNVEGGGRKSWTRLDPGLAELLLGTSVIRANGLPFPFYRPRFEPAFVPVRKRRGMGSLEKFVLPPRILLFLLFYPRVSILRVCFI